MHLLDKKSDPKRPTVRSGSMRKLAKDGTTWTGTELRRRNECLKQFCRFGRKGVEESSGASELYRQNFDAIDWGKK